MSALPPWDDLIAGRGCPFCAARADIDDYAFKIADLKTSTLFLDREQVYRGYSLLIFKGRHVNGIEQLTPEEYAGFSADLKTAADAVFKAVQPEHMNYATLGNVIPHLHYHIIPRRSDDPRWGAPVWTSHLKDMHKKELAHDEYLSLVEKIKSALKT